MDGDSDDKPDDRRASGQHDHGRGHGPMGDERVDTALARLGDLDGAAISAHASIYDDVHRSLAAVLDDPAVVPEK